MKQTIRKLLTLLLLTCSTGVWAQNVAKIGATEYATLQAAFNVVPGGTITTIDILSDIDEPTTSRGTWSNPKIVLNLHGHSVTIGGMSGLAGLTINGEGGKLTVKDVDGIHSSNNDTPDNELKIDKATVILEQGMQWLPLEIMLKNHADVTVYDRLSLGSANGTHTLVYSIDESSRMELKNCKMNVPYTPSQAYDALVKYVYPDLQASFNYDNWSETKYNLTLRGQWFLELQSLLGANAVVTFYRSKTEPTIDGIGTFTSAGNGTSDNPYKAEAGEYVVMYIDPADGYWMDASLLYGIEVDVVSWGARRRAPGIDRINPVKLLQRGEDTDGNTLYDGTGYYYYQIPSGHNEYKFSTIDGFVTKKFDLSTASASTDGKTLTISNGDGWTTTVAIDENSFTYTGLAQGPVFSATTQTLQVKKGDDNLCVLDPLSKQITLTGNSQTNASATAYNATVGAVANGCFKNSKTVPFTIAQAALTVTADDKTVVYGAAAPTYSLTYSGFVNNETAATAFTTAPTASCTYVAGNSVGTYPITVTSGVAANYTVTYTNGTLTVNRKGVNDDPDSSNGESQVTILFGTVSTPPDYTYDGTAKRPEITVKDDDTVIPTTEYTVSYKNNVDAGTATVVVSNATGGNYVVNGEKNFTIAPKAVTVTVTAANKVYDGNTTATLTATIETGVTGETLTVSGLTGTFADANAGTGKTVTIDASNATVTAGESTKLTNYTVSYPTTTTADITAKAVTATVTAANKVYDGNTTATLTATIETGVTGETLTVSGLTGTFDNANVGTGKTVTIDASNATVTASANTKLSNYTISYPNTTTADITAKGVNDDPDSGSGEDQVTILFGTVSTPPDYTYDGTAKRPEITVKDDDTVIPTTEYTVSYKNNVDAGTATVVVSNATGGNYVVNGEKNFTIAPKAVTVTVTAANKVYDGNTTATLTATIETGVTGETLTVSGLTGTFADANAGTGKTVTIDASNATVTAGANTKLSNYTISYPNTTTADITAKGVNDDPDSGEGESQVTILFGTVSTPPDYTYDGTAKRPEITVKDDDTVIPTTEYTVSYKNNVDAGTATVVVSNATGGNYVVNGEKNFTIAPKAVTVTVTAANKVYDGNTTATLTATIETGVTGETLTVSGLTGTFADANAGTGKTVTIDASNATVTAGANTKTSNYTISYPTTTTADITKADPTLTAPTAKIDLVENDTDQELVNAGSATGGTLEYSLDGKTWSTNIPTGKDAGTYTVYYRVTGDQNHNDIAAAKLEVTIAESSVSVDHKHSGIRVVRNDTKEVIDNDVYLTNTNGQLRIDRIDICETNDLEKLKQVGVSIYIPEELTAPNGTKAKTYGMGSDIIDNKNGLPVTDIYMPETKEMLNVGLHAFRLDAKESTTAFIHVPLHLLDDYALTPGLKAEYEAGKVMTTVKPTTTFWTFSSAVDVVMPNGLSANICKSEGDTEVAFEALTSPTTVVDGVSRLLIKANNGILMMGVPNVSYDLRAWPSEDRPSGMSPIPTDNANSYPDNELVPAIVPTHFEPTQYYILFENNFCVLDPGDDTSVSACKAVLPRTSNLQARTLTIVGGDTTGIMNSEKGIVNSDVWYSLDGRRLSMKPQRAGVYIHNGKQEIIK